MTQASPVSPAALPVHRNVRNPPAFLGRRLPRREIISIRHQHPRLAFGEVSVSNPVLWQGNLYPAFAIGPDPAQESRSISISAVVKDTLPIPFPHFVTGPVSGGAPRTFVPEAMVLFAVPKPQSSNPAIRRPLVIVKQQIRVNRAKLHMGDPAARNFLAGQ